MFDFSTIAAIVGGGSLIGLVLVAVFAPSVLSVAAEWLKALSPLVKGVAEGLVEFAKALWSGFKDMADNAASILFVCTVIAVTAWFFHKPCDCSDAAAKQIHEFRTQYKLIPRSSKEKREYISRAAKPATDIEWRWPWE